MSNDRLRKPHEFKAVYTSGQFARSGPYRVHVLKNGTARNRVGFVVPKKVFPRAVDRNRARRLLREAYRALRESLASGNDIVISVSGKELALEHVKPVERKLYEGFEYLHLLK